jgi:hypothetical protein
MKRKDLVDPSRAAQNNHRACSPGRGDPAFPDIVLPEESDSAEQQSWDEGCLIADEEEAGEAMDDGRLFVEEPLKIVLRRRMSHPTPLREGGATT